MRLTDHKIFLLAEPSVNWSVVGQYFDEMGYSQEWLDRVRDDFDISDIEAIDEFAGRRCYRSFGVGDNPNITQVRKSSETWYDNVRKTAHGSVMEHGQFTFAFENVSRIFTHELVRHRVGIAISQESMRFVRLQDIPMWIPEWAKDNPKLMMRAQGLVEAMENFQRWMAQEFGLEAPCEACGGSGWSTPDPDGGGAPRLRPDEDANPAYVCEDCMGSGLVPLEADFAMKKHYTSFMRRFAPEGVSTGIVWSSNIRTLRFVLVQRTSTGAEEEIREVFDKVAEMMVTNYPLAFGDFTRNNNGEWTTPNHKV